MVHARLGQVEFLKERIQMSVLRLVMQRALFVKLGTLLRFH